MNMALNAAEQFHGATSPNPPAGAIALDRSGKVLLGAGFQSGPLTVEGKLLDLAGKLGKAGAIETLVLTLEPSAPEEILRFKNIRRVVLGALDPRPGKQGKALARLKSAGLEVIEGVLAQDCEFLIRAFAKISRTGQPYVTIKAVMARDGTLLRAPSKIAPSTAVVVHELRKRADALWTGSGTALAGAPDLGVKAVTDHPGRKRILMLSDRRRRIGADWLKQATAQGFSGSLFAASLEDGLAQLAAKKVTEVLVEAGESLRNAWLESGLWDESVVILQGDEETDDEVDISFRHEAGTEAGH